MSASSSISAAVTALLVALIRVYQHTVGAWMFSGMCRFTPSCSRYAEAVIRSHGPVRGALLAGKRLLRCHPLGGSGHDPAPEITNGGGR